MFNRNHDSDPMQQNYAAAKAHEESLVRLGQMGAVSEAKCALYPGTDAIRVRRVGPEKMPTTFVGVTVAQSGATSGVVLRPTDARRIAMALLDAADEADGTHRLDFVVKGLPSDGEGQ